MSFSASVQSGQDDISIIQPPNLKNPVQREVLLFISFDLSGCTKFKNVTDEWLQKLTPYFQNLKQRFTIPSTGKRKWDNLEIKPWKFAGDELLFIVSVKNLEVVKNVVDFTFMTLQNEVVEVRSISTELSMKAAIWIALIDGEHNGVYKDDDEEYAGAYQDSSKEQREFIGINIDEGFRVAKHFAKPKRLALSFDVAQILTKQLAKQKKKKNFPIVCVGYEKLKGVWRDQAYPALWYSNDDWNDIRKHLTYDLHLECALTNELKREIIWADEAFFKRINEDPRLFFLTHYRRIITFFSK
jgi:hypothetical protein